MTDLFLKVFNNCLVFLHLPKSELSWNFQARCKSRGGGGGERGEEGGGGEEKPRRRKKKWAGGEFFGAKYILTISWSDLNFNFFLLMMMRRRMVMSMMMMMIWMK